MEVFLTLPCLFPLKWTGRLLFNNNNSGIVEPGNNYIVAGIILPPKKHLDQSAQAHKPY